MMMFRTIRIRKHERGLRFAYGDFKRLLGPGTYRLKRWPWNIKADTVEVIDTLRTKFEHALLDVLITDEQVKAALLVVDLNDNERVLVWKDERLAYIVGPGRHAFWRTPYTLRVETFDVNDVRFEHPRAEAIRRHADAAKWLQGVTVDAHEQVMLFRNGELIETLGQGTHLFWQHAGVITWKAVDRRELIADVAGQEIMTSDKVTLRVNLVVAYVVTDAVKAVTAVSDYAQALYREAQLALRAAIGTRTLDALLGDKEVIGNEVRDALSERVAEFGVAVRSVGLRDIILPGEMKMILNQVITAEKQAQANLIKRREETAAARSQANTARLLADNPVLARMKELEMLQEIFAGADTTFVFGNTDLVDQMRRLIAAGQGNPAD